MQRKSDTTKKVYNAGRGKICDDVVHLHMSNHYRRILNAKKTVDNSPPYCYKIRRPLTSKPARFAPKQNEPFENLPLTDRSTSTNSNKDSNWGGESYVSGSRYHARCIPEPPGAAKVKANYGMNLVDRIAYDTKNGPSAYCESNWAGMKSEPQVCLFSVQQTNTKINNNGNNTNTVMAKTSPSVKRHLPNTGINEAAKTRKFADQLQNKTEPCASVSANCKCTKICVCDANETTLKKISLNPKEQSVTSSRDSAYNGGVSSLPESRSPTPDHRKKKDCCCCCCEKKQQRGGKPFIEATKPLGSRVPSPRPPLPTSPSPALIASPQISPKPKNKDQDSFEKLQEDAVYVKFIQDITTEILDKNLYTNKALKKVMKKHIRNNIKKLSKERMIKEVENLRIQLGIPEDKSLLELEAECEEISKSYPIISDSEFVMPKKGIVRSHAKTSPNEQTPEKVPKSISDVMATESETDNGEVISVIQVMKTVREKRKEKSVEKVIAVQNSSDDSDRPSDPKKRSVLQSRKQKYTRAYTSSSSDSERSGKYSISIRETAECEASSSKETYLGEYAQKSVFLTKKNRSVSFWKNPDLNTGRTSEVKHKKSEQRINHPHGGWQKKESQSPNV